MKPAVTALIIMLTAGIGGFGLFMFVCLGIIFLVEQPQHIVWHKLVGLTAFWLFCLLLHFFLRASDFAGGRSAGDRFVLKLGVSIVTHLRVSKTFRVLWIAGTFAAFLTGLISALRLVGFIK